MPTLSQIGELLDRYREFVKRGERDALDRFASDFDRLRSGVAGVLERVYERERRTASRFNFMEALGVERDETIHSKFLSHILDPSGSHGQGPFFLNSFLRFCEREIEGFTGILQRDITRQDFVFVKTEYFSGYGRPDILASCRDPTFALIIENKIGAADQDQQLQRYWCLLRRHFTFAGKNTALIYLTPSGRPPEEKSWIPNDVRYACMSYKEHVAQWLRLCVSDLPNRLQQVLMQYADVTERFDAEQGTTEEDDGHQKRE
jgi:hypothetical protein